MTDKAYPYSSIDDVVRIVIPSEYFFPYFVSTVEELMNDPIYQATRTILLDFTECHSLHGIGMSVEAQMFYEQAKAQGKYVYWVGSPDMHTILTILNADTGNKTLPYRDI